MNIKRTLAIAAGGACILGLGIGLYPVYSSPSVPTPPPSATVSPSPTPSSPSPSPSPTPTEEPSEAEEAEPTATATPNIGEPSTLTVVAGGDVLLHMPVNNAARTASGYDYTPLLAGVASFVSGADVALCGMETALAPVGEAPSDYPTFGAPDGIVASLAATGFDGCSTANNHSVDRGFASLTHTLDVFDAAGLGHAGTARSEEESARTAMYVLESGGRTVSIAHLSYTSVDNFLPSLTGTPWAWNTVVSPRASFTIEEVIAAARQARERGADLVLVSFHWGVEYDSIPSAEERTIARELADSGEVDAIFGSHPHVPQGIEHLEGGPGGEGMWVIYSMGNMISNQDSNAQGIEVLTGVLATATVAVPSEGPARVVNMEWTGVTTDRATHRIHLLADLEAGRAASSLGSGELAARRSALQAVMGGGERTAPPSPVARYVGFEQR